MMHLLLGPAAHIPLLVAPMGASAVLLFAVPASPLAQPWSIIGGNLIAATAGVACASWIATPILAAALAVALAVGAMFALRCVHPPSGAVALTAVLGGPEIHALGYHFVATPIALQSALLLCAALVYHAVTGHRYPHAAPQASSPGPATTATTAGTVRPHDGFTRADLEAVLKQRGELLDIDPGDLEALLRDVQLQAYARTFSELTCADIMSRTLVSVSATTRATTAWELLQQRHIKALPVTDEKQHVIGIVTRADLINAHIPGAASEQPPSMRRGFQRWFKRRAATAPQIGTLMTVVVQTVDSTTPIVELVPVFANYGHHHIPVLDADKRLAGMITQADLIAGLYRQRAAQQQRIA